MASWVFQIYKRNFSELHNGQDNDTLTINMETEPCKKYVYDTSVYKSTLVTKMNLVCDQKYKVTMFYTAFTVGMIGSSSLFANLVDRIGRKPSYVIASIGTVVMTLGAAFVDNYYLYCVFRFFIGFFVKAMTSVSYILGLELVGPAYRSYVATFFMMIWAVGYMFLAGLAYFINDHVNLQIAIGCIASILLITVWFVPESPRWLLSKKKRKKALAVCERMAKWNNVPLSTDYTLTTTNTEEKKEGSQNPLDLFRTKYMRRNTFVLFFGWMSVSFVYYAISWNTSSLGGNDYINFFLAAVVEVPGYIMNLVALNKFGRRWSTSVTILLSGVMLFCIMPIPKDLFIPRVTLAMLTKLLVTAAFAMVWQYASELYLTNFRALGMGCCNTMARFGGLIASNVILLAAIHEALPSVLLGIIPIVSGLLFMLTPETRGRPLPQSVADVEREGRQSSPLRCCQKASIVLEMQYETKPMT